MPCYKSSPYAVLSRTDSKGIYMQILIDLDNTLINHTKAQRSASFKFGKLLKNKIPKYSEDTFCDFWDEIMLKYYQKFLDQELTFEEKQAMEEEELAEKLSKKISVPE